MGPRGVRLRGSNRNLGCFCAVIVLLRLDPVFSASTAKVAHLLSERPAEERVPGEAAEKAGAAAEAVDAFPLEEPDWVRLQATYAAQLNSRAVHGEVATATRFAFGANVHCYPTSSETFLGLICRAWT